VSPYEDPKLVDEDSYSFQKNRTLTGDGPAGIAWAEDRLKGLGFQQTDADRVRSYTRLHTNNHGSFVLYADPAPSAT
jgi:hypothetical protein